MKRYTAENIEIRRKQLKISREEFCIKILMSKSKYYRCLKKNDFSLSEIDLIAKVLKTSASQLAYSKFVLGTSFV